ncbi:cell division protein DamX [Cronobacter sakazakii]|nr:cell division protein DamX [Cronobacter sakazakii]EKK4068497.1 cell division protein DamX [Cronobacter sakazakii]ELY4105447.1 cell division protein DamX [Cronobacter sakazakii]
MDEFKPEDELKPDPSDRRPGRSRKSAEFDNEPQINIDDVDLDADDRRPARARREQTQETYEADESLADDEEVQERRPRKRKKAPPKGPISRQHLMMALGIFVLVLLIIGIGSALKGPDTTKTDDAQAQNAEKNIDLSGNAGSASDQANGAQPGNTSAANQNSANAPQDISLPPVSSTPTQAESPSAPQGQQRVEVPGDLNNALTQQQGQIDNAVAGSTLPTEPATVAPVNGNAAAAQPSRDTAQSEKPARHNAATTTRPERKQMVIESEPRKTQTTQSKPQQTPAKTATTEQKPASTPKRSEPATGTASAPVKAPATTATQAPKSTPAASQPSAPAGGASAGNVGALKSAPGSHYTLQLSSSSNYNNLNAWAKKENLKNYVVYQTTRNGQPWYVLVSGVYGSKDEAKRAVSSLPADVQAKNPWAKPIHQVQADLK